MQAKKRVAGPRPRSSRGTDSQTGGTQTDPAVDEFLSKLDHPLKPVLEAVRKTILGADPRIREGIKWNAPSFHFKEYFATAGLRSREDFVRVVFHVGAKVKDNSTKGMQINEPTGLLEWLARERCSTKIHDLKDVKSKEAALRSVVRQWIEQM